MLPQNSRPTIARRTALQTVLTIVLLAWGGAHAESTDHARYAQAKQQWLATDAQNYQFTFTQHCFCRWENQGALRVTVQNGAVHSAIWLNNGQAASAAMVQHIPSINRIFQQIDAGYAKPAQEIRLTFSADYGYPERVFIDYHKMIADEELAYILSDFMP